LLLLLLACSIHRRGWVPGLKLLLAGAAAANIPNKRGLTALGEAVAAGHAAAAEVLLQAGADARCKASG
jgi:ankyrin repeat protein